MKYFINAVILLAALCSAEIQHPDAKLITHPDFLFARAWKHQVILANLQGEINEAILEVQTAVSSVLRVSSSETLDQYESHVNSVQAEYRPMVEALEGLPRSQCRDNAEFLLDFTVRMTGFEASNCAATYNTHVSNAIDIANKALVKIDDVYNQVQTIVVKSFVAQNAFVTPEDVNKTIIEMTELVEGRWESTRPEIQGVKLTLENSVADQNRQLGNCHAGALKFAIDAYALFSQNVQTCIDFNNIQNPMGRSARQTRDYRAELEALAANFKPYEWIN
jgi:hypothetical protein